MTVLKELNNQITKVTNTGLNLLPAEVIDFRRKIMLSIKGVSKSFKEVQAVNNISLDIGLDESLAY